MYLDGFLYLTIYIDIIIKLKAECEEKDANRRSFTKYFIYDFIGYITITPSPLIESSHATPK